MSWIPIGDAAGRLIRKLAKENAGRRCASPPDVLPPSASYGRKVMDKVTKSKSRPGGVTGRDGYLMAQALAYTITIIALLPSHWQEWSNAQDMEAILAAYCDERGVKHHLENAQRHLEGGIGEILDRAPTPLAGSRPELVIDNGR